MAKAKYRQTKRFALRIPAGMTPDQVRETLMAFEHNVAEVIGILIGVEAGFLPWAEGVRDDGQRDTLPDVLAGIEVRLLVARSIVGVPPYTKYFQLRRAA